MTKSLYEILEEKLNSRPDQIAYRIKRGLRQTVWTNKKVLEDSNRLRQYFQKIGIKTDDRIMIWAPNMPEWSITFLSCLASGIVVVPVDVRSNWQTVENYIKEIKPKCIFCSKLTAIDLEKSEVDIYYFEDIFRNLPENTKALNQVSHPKKIIEILFTSGTSSSPKGVIIKESNVIAQLKQSEILIPPLARYETVSILPLSHIYEQMYDFFLPIYRFGTVNYLVRINPLSLKKSLRRYKATYLMVVPEFLRLLWDDILLSAEKIGQRKKLETMLLLGKVLPKSLNRLVFKQIHKSFGGELSLITCGGAPLEKKLAHIFETMGFTLIEGYGSTETVGIVTCMNWKDRIFGTVGKPTKNVLVKIGYENEILVKGAVVSAGYYHQKNSTQDSFKDGWYKTGDTGRFDQKGNLVITGRVSSRIVLEDGTKVYPEDIERTLNNQKEIKDSCVVEKETPQGPAVHAYVIGRVSLTPEILDRIVKRVNKELESKQQIASWAIWPDPKFPRTRTLKIDRKSVAKKLVGGVSSVAQGLEDQSLGDFESIVKRVSKRSHIKPDDRLGDDLGLDSLRRVQLIAMLEDNLGVLVDDVNLTAQTTVRDLRKSLKQDVDNKTLLVEKVLDSFAMKNCISRMRSAFQSLIIFPVFMYWVKFKIEKGEDVLDDLPNQAIYIFNHIGMFDVLGVMSLLPGRVRKMLAIPVTNERWSDGNKSIQTLIELVLGGYPFAREGKDANAGLAITGELVDRGSSVLIAPEGAMEREGKMKNFKPGLGYLVRELDLPVIMVKIGDEFREILPPPPAHLVATNSKYYFPRRRGEVGIRIAKATIDNKLSDDELTKYLQKQFEAL